MTEEMIARQEYETRHAELRQQITDNQRDLRESINKLEGEIDVLARQVTLLIAGGKAVFWKLIATSLLTGIIGFAGGVGIDLFLRR